MKLGRLIIPFLMLLFSKSIASQEKSEWFYPSKINFETSDGDTSFYAGIPSVWRILMGDSLYDFYPDGNLQAISEIKNIKAVKFRSRDKNERIVYQYNYHGLMKIYFDDSSKTIAATGLYKNNEQIGEWRFFNHQSQLIKKTYPMLLWNRFDYFDSSGTLIRQEDYANNFDKSTKVREAIFINGVEKVISNKPFFAKIFYRFTLAYMIIFMLIFFGRVFINSRIYNIENETDYSPIYFFAFGYVSKNYTHSILSTFSFWFSSYKPENRKMVLITNTLSLLLLTMFFLPLIVFTISGEL